MFWLFMWLNWFFFFDLTRLRKVKSWCQISGVWFFVLFCTDLFGSSVTWLVLFFSCWFLLKNRQRHLVKKRRQITMAMRESMKFNFHLTSRMENTAYDCENTEIPPSVFDYHQVYVKLCVKAIPPIQVGPD